MFYIYVLIEEDDYMPLYGADMILFRRLGDRKGPTFFQRCHGSLNPSLGTPLLSIVLLSPANDHFSQVCRSRDASKRCRTTAFETSGLD